MQPSLFPSETQLLVDDDRGAITYIPRFIDGATAARWFAELRDGVAWRSERRLMYEREVDVPRLMGHYRLDPPPDSIPPAILDAANRVGQELNVPFNSVGLNLYRDGRDSVAPHNDHLDELQRGFPIALLSLGAARRMTVRARTTPAAPAATGAARKPAGAAAPVRVLHVDLEPGSLFVMDYRTQIHYTHAIPKTADAVGERISLAFRVKRRQVAAGPPAPDFYR